MRFKNMRSDLRTALIAAFVAAIVAAPLSNAEHAITGHAVRVIVKRGPRGPRGFVGATGPAGAAGKVGPAGPTGPVYTPPSPGGASQPPLSTSVAGHTQATLAAACPAGYFATGGTASAAPSTTYVIGQRVTDDGNGYQATARNSDGAAATLAVSVYCAPD